MKVHLTRTGERIDRRTPTTVRARNRLLKEQAEWTRLKNARLSGELVDAIHHFGRTEQFIAEARRLLRAGGTLAAIGMDPHHGRDYWCVYDYFPETKATDRARYPSSGQMIDVMLQAEFEGVDCRAACRFAQTRRGRSVLEDPELQRRGCSQMALLSDEQYAAGLERIVAALELSKSEPPEFKVDIAMMMLCAQVPDRGEERGTDSKSP